MTTLNHNGTLLTLTQDAYADYHSPTGSTIYRAGASDPAGNRYTVTWVTVPEWADHYTDEDGECVVDDCNGWCDDESNACDWDEYDVELVEYADTTD